MKAVVAAFNQEKALVGAFSVITNLRMQLFEALVWRVCREYASNATVPQTMHSRCWAGAGAVSPVYSLGISVLTPRLETLLTLRNPAFQGISDESSILLTWQT